MTLDFPQPSLEHSSLRMSEYGFIIDDSRDGVFPPQSFFAESAMPNCLTYRTTLPLETQLSPVIPHAHARRAR